MSKCFLGRFVIALIALRALGWSVPDASCLAGVVSQVEILVHNEYDQPLPCRIHLVDAEGAVHQPPNLPFWHDHFVCPGRVTLSLLPGKYELTTERGPEYRSIRREIEVADEAQQQVAILLPRIADLRQAGWYSADLHVHRPLEHVELLMQAADLDFAPVITWWNDRNLWQGREIPAEVLRRFDGHRLYHVMAGEDEREGGALLYFGLARPIDITGAAREVPSPLAFAEAAIRDDPNVWIDIEKPFWWDVPAWLASGKVKSIGIANNHMCRSTMLADEAWGRPRDKVRLPDPLGVGHWTQEIYYHALNSGLRIPPSAGSASGVLPNPVGYNRVYAHLDGELTHDNWWRALGEGKCFVTNGPLIVCRAGGELPGHVFSAPDKDSLTLPVEVSLTSADRVKKLEVIHNGKVVKTIDCGDALSQDLQAEVEIHDSGWFLIRGIAENENTFRFASTGPFYVELGGEREHISRASCEFFLKWVDERIGRVSGNIDSAQDRRDVLSYHEAARYFWKGRLDKATAP